MSERFYDDQIAFEAFGHEGLILGRLYAPPGNGMAVLAKLFPAADDWRKPEKESGRE